VSELQPGARVHAYHYPGIKGTVERKMDVPELPHVGHTYIVRWDGGTVGYETKANLLPLEGDK
jgi:hypothetical protein